MYYHSIVRHVSKGLSLAVGTALALLICANVFAAPQAGINLFKLTTKPWVEAIHGGVVLPFAGNWDGSPSAISPELWIIYAPVAQELGRVYTPESFTAMGAQARLDAINAVLPTVTERVLLAATPLIDKMRFRAGA